MAEPRPAAPAAGRWERQDGYGRVISRLSTNELIDAVQTYKPKNNREVEDSDSCRSSSWDGLSYDKQAQTSGALKKKTKVF